MEIDSVDFDVVSQYSIYSQTLSNVTKDDRCPCDNTVSSISSMKSQSDVMVMATTYANMSHITHMIGKTFEKRPEKELSLIKQYNAGILQKRIEDKEVDPQALINRAILENSPKVIRYLISLGIDVDLPDENNMSPLTFAILNKCTYAVELLLAQGAKPNTESKWNGYGLLELAILMNDAAAAHLLMEYGADVNAQNKTGESILAGTLNAAGATTPPNHELIKIAMELVKRGADMHASFQFSFPPLTQATWLACNGDATLLKFFIKKGADLNKDHSWGTPLFAAISHGNLDVVKLLVKSGADVNLCLALGIEETDPNWTPLKYALELHKTDIASYLVQMGANS